jgi:hypothetical protein
MQTTVKPFKNLSIPADMHRELKIASAHRGEEIKDVLRRAWEAFKKAEGSRLHRPVTSDAA